MRSALGVRVIMLSEGCKTCGRLFGRTLPSSSVTFPTAVVLHLAFLGTAPYSGIAGQTTVAVPRLDDAGVTIDANFEEAAWSRAATLTGFSEYTPVDGRPADDSTEVLVWYSSTAIYFGIRAFERQSRKILTGARRRRPIARARQP